MNIFRAFIFAILCSGAALAQNECRTVSPAYFVVPPQSRDASNVVHDIYCQDVVTGKIYPSPWFITSGSSVSFASLTSGINVQAAMQVGTSANISPLNAGQVADSQMWMLPGIVAPSLTAGATSSGSLLQTRGIVAEVTYNTASGETLPSSYAQIAVNAAGCTSNCSVTVTAPTLPTGYSGYTVYACELFAGTYPGTGCGSPATLVRLASCTNITSSCLITVTPSGATQPPTTLTAWIQPPNIQPATLVPLGAIPTIFFPKTDGNYYPLAGVDPNGGSPLPSPDGSFSIWHRTFINDSGLSLGAGTQAGGGCIKNTLFGICHLSGQTTGTGAGVDDRAIAVRSTDSPTSATYEQWLGYYGEHFVYNNNFSCAPVGNEDCTAAIRARTNDQRTAGVNNANFTGISGTASTNVTTPKLGSCAPCVVGVRGYAVQETVTGQNASSAYYAGVWGFATGSAGNTNGNGVSFYAQAPTTRFAGQNIGLFVGSFTNAADFSIRSDATSKSYFRGAVDVDSLNPINNGTIPSGGSITAKAFTGTQLNSNGGAATILTIGVTGATSYTYRIVYKDSNGLAASASSNINTVAGNATLNGSNFNRIQFYSSAQSQVLNCPSTIDVYRTVSGGTPSSTGKIGTFTVTDCTAFYNSQTFDDTGLAGDSTAPATVNMTGGVAGTLFIGGTAYVTSNYTNATTTFSNVTGLAFNVAASKNYKVSCDLDYQTSATTADVKIQWTGPASPTAVTYDLVTEVTGSTLSAAVATAFSSALSEAGTPTTATNFPLRTTLTLINGATDGTVQLQAAATGVGTITIIPGSCTINQ